MEETISLYFNQGSSDKVYLASLTQLSGPLAGWEVRFAYGRKGSTLTTGHKCQGVPYNKAKKIYDQLVASKMVKGYIPTVGAAPKYATELNDGKVQSGLLPQLLNAIDDEADLEAFFTNVNVGMQEKKDGRRILIRKKGSTVEFINKKGIIVGGPEEVAEELKALNIDLTLDGEMIGEQYHAFDILNWKDHDLRSLAYLKRHEALTAVSTKLFWFDKSPLSMVPLVLGESEKRYEFEKLRAAHAEGVVFKELTAPVTVGRPNSGGPQRKFKFTATATCFVRQVNNKRSVALGLQDGNDLVSVGNVTIPVNQEVPQLGDLVEIRYLYFFKGGSLFQPAYLGVRDDQNGADDVSTLKVKAGSDEDDE